MVCFYRDESPPYASVAALEAGRRPGLELRLETWLKALAPQGDPTLRCVVLLLTGQVQELQEFDLVGTWLCDGRRSAGALLRAHLLTSLRKAGLPPLACWAC